MKVIPIILLFLSCNGWAQNYSLPTVINHPSVELHTSCYTLLDGNIATANSLDVIAYSNYHVRINNCLSPFLILQEPIPHNILMAHKRIQFINETEASLALFSPYSADNEIASYFAADPESLPISSVPGDTPDNTTPKLGRSPLGLLVICYQAFNAIVNTP
jgi:hypothetical protein